MKSYINQYKLLFLLLWISLYLIYPVWALPVSVAGRFLIYMGLMIYFTISAYFMNTWFNAFPADKPFTVKPVGSDSYRGGLLNHIKDHKWLLITFCIALVLHVFKITSPILNLGDEALHLQGGLWVYDFLGSDWHKFLQLISWVVIVIVFIIKIRNSVIDFFSRRLDSLYQRIYSNNIIKYFFVVILLSFFIVYFLLLKDITYHLSLIRYPPVSRFLYLISFLIFGITHIGPRIIQLIFYFLSAIYIYRTINLFCDKETSLLGASIYLFSPVAFHYAHIAQLTSGVVFLTVIISFYFLRFLKDKNNRDLLLTSFLIGTGFLYKEDILLMFFVCASYLIFNSLRKKNIINLKSELKVLLISLVPVIPWMVTQRFFNWRQYNVVWSHFVSLDILSRYFYLILTQISWILFLLFIISIIFMFFNKRNELSMFYGFIFVAFYLFYTADYTAKYIQHRFSIIFYPTIAVFLSQFIFNIINKIRWKHFFKIAYCVLAIYLIVLSTNPYLGIHVFADKMLKFPSDKAMKWVKDNVKDGEKILILRIMPAQFYRDKYDIDKDKIIHFWYEIGNVSTHEKLKKFCIENRINYIMFPYSPEYPFEGEMKILKYLKESQNNEFMEIARFNIGENYIFIYKLKEK